MTDNDLPGRSSGSYGQNPYDQTPEGFDTPGDRGAAGGGAFPAYPGSNTSAEGNGAFPTHAGGAGEYQPFTYTEPGEELVQSNSTVTPVGALGFGFSRFFKNILPWLGVILLTFAVSVVFSIPTQFSGLAALASFVSAAVSIIFSCAMLTGAVKNVSSTKVPFKEFFSNVAWLPIIVVSLVSGLISTFILAGLFFLLPGPRKFLSELVALDPSVLEDLSDPANPEASSAASEVFMSLPWGGLITGVVIVAVLYLLLNPILNYWVFYAADHRAGIGGSITQGFNDALKNYKNLLVFEILATLTAIVISLFSLFILAPFVVAPIMIARALVYRQMSRGPIPASVVQ